MKALCWHGTGKVQVDNVPEPKIQDSRDAIIRITASGICGSDLHLLDGFIPTMKSGDILGHEPMGIVEEVGSGVTKLRRGDRVVVPFTISCGSCFFCEKQLFSCCDRSNPNAEIAAKLMGHSPAGLFGYSHMLGGFAGGQAEYLRVPFADIGPIKIESNLPDEKVLFLSDIFPTGYMAAENCDIEPGDTVAIWGCGPVGQFAIQSSWMFKAGRVIAIDRVPERLRMAEQHGKAETIDFSQDDVYTRLQEMTGGRGPDRVIDAVGCEAHAASTWGVVVDKVSSTVMPSDQLHALSEAIKCCRKGGTVSVPGAYGGLADKLPLGAFMNKGLTMKTGQTHMQKYMKPLLQKIEDAEIDPSFVITHRVQLKDAADAYYTFRDKKDGCIKVVLAP
ncbi:zinc-dependent alcohol dehydrogenase [Anatilimnocola floriformis]|uniref:zinc-dependent alcohol dehydrogenase n=1 Tax=Anatilimnocola floriformis TaxID=2948575 RepID=UPI0020C2C6AB|nr:zinc-dependent alcohol dehydrogenase [Anatilimnocola floriformis]